MEHADSRHPGDVYFGLVRIVLGFIFLWAFFDKLLGLGYATKPEQAWLSGGSPTNGFLLHAVQGPLAGFYHSLAGIGIIDWLFMLGLLGIGLSLILGIGLKIAGYAGAILTLLMWSALFPNANNPLVDEHVVYAFLFLGFAYTHVGRSLSLAQWWKQTDLVKQNPILE